ncbi:MAG: cupredoxin domain-containing protein [Rhizomicrobium sp.]|jgi:plastocyanin
MMKRIAAALAICTVAGTCQAATVSVDQHNLSFDKADLTVNKGDIVAFNNGDNTSHNILISGDGLSLNGGLQQPGQTFSAPFIKSGTFQVTCAIHPKMKLTIHVP